MSLIDKIYTPQASVNDEYLTVLDIFCKNGTYIEKDELLAELETSKAVIEIRSEKDGYIKVLAEKGTDIKVGTVLFEFYDSNIDIISNENSNLQTEIQENTLTKVEFNEIKFSK